MKGIVPARTRMPLLKPEPCSLNKADGIHCWHSAARGAIDKDRMKCCHCNSSTTNTKLFNPSRNHGRFGVAPKRIQEEA